MKAIQFSQAGAARDVLSLIEVEPTQPGPDDVQIRVAYSAVNPTDVKRRGSGRELGALTVITPNNDGAGVIEAVGANIDPSRIGENVWIFGAQAGRSGGTAAEYCTLPAWMAISIPDGATLLDGACLGVPAVTAYYSIYSDGPVDGQWILVSGGGGRVGAYAVQMAKLGGAKVIATGSKADGLAYAKSLGADHVINYRDEDVTARVLEITGGRGVDRVSEVAFGANISMLPKIVVVNGMVTSYSSDAIAEPVMPFLDFMFKNITVRPYSIYGLPRDTLKNSFVAITEMLAQGQLEHRVGATHTFSLEGVIAAQEMIEADASAGVCTIEI